MVSPDQERAWSLRLICTYFLEKRKICFPARNRNTSPLSIPHHNHSTDRAILAPRVFEVTVYTPKCTTHIFQTVCLHQTLFLIIYCMSIYIFVAVLINCTDAALNVTNYTGIPGVIPQSLQLQAQVTLASLG